MEYLPYLEDGRYVVGSNKDGYHYEATSSWQYRIRMQLSTHSYPQANGSTLVVLLRSGQIGLITVLKAKRLLSTLTLERQRKKDRSHTKLKSTKAVFVTSEDVNFVLNRRKVFQFGEHQKTSSVK
jgi:hypothetical protein